MGAAVVVAGEPAAGGGVAAGGDSASGGGAGAARSASRAEVTWSAASSALAPEATAIWFSPAASTTISATPVGEDTRATPLTSMPSRANSATASAPSSSSPTAPTNATAAPSLAAATAWLADLPPPNCANRPPATVSPAAGSRATATTRSTLIDPTTTTRGGEEGTADQPTARRALAISAATPSSTRSNPNAKSSSGVDPSSKIPSATALAR